jgi:alkylated DNA repair dioxygenase AlkB
VGVPPLVWQGSLFASGAPGVDPAFADLVRHRLDDRSWADHAPGWVQGADEVFAGLVAAAPWQQRRRHMYDKVVDEPRLTAWWDVGSASWPLPAPVEQMRSALSARYDVDFDSVGVNLYRDGRDSVAWHGDRIARRIEDPIVAIVSAGEPRRFLLRPGRGGPTVRTFVLHAGDLLVMGGACQRTWQHAVPKVARAGPRMSITFRHTC